LTRTIALAALVALLCGACRAARPGEPCCPHCSEHPPGAHDECSCRKDDLPEWKGSDSPEQIEALGKLGVAQLTEFLADSERHPALRVEAMRLLAEMSDGPDVLFPALLASLQGRTLREREAALYYFSALGRPEHVDAIRESAKTAHDCVDHSSKRCCSIDYSIECTIRQIMERAGEKAPKK